MFNHTLNLTTDEARFMQDALRAYRAEDEMLGITETVAVHLKERVRQAAWACDERVNGPCATH